MIQGPRISISPWASSSHGSVAPSSSQIRISTPGIARPDVVAEAVGEFSQEYCLGGLVPVSPVDVQEEPYMEVRLGIHPRGESR